MHTHIHHRERERERKKEKKEKEKRERENATLISISKSVSVSLCVCVCIRARASTPRSVGAEGRDLEIEIAMVHAGVDPAPDVVDAHERHDAQHLRARWPFVSLRFLSVCALLPLSAHPCSHTLPCLDRMCVRLACVREGYRERERENGNEGEGARKRGRETEGPIPSGTRTHCRGTGGESLCAPAAPCARQYRASPRLPWCA